MHILTAGIKRSPHLSLRGSRYRSIPGCLLQQLSDRYSPIAYIISKHHREDNTHPAAALPSLHSGIPSLPYFPYIISAGTYISPASRWHPPSYPSILRSITSLYWYRLSFSLLCPLSFLFLPFLSSFPLLVDPALFLTGTTRSGHTCSLACLPTYIIAAPIFLTFLAFASWMSMR